MAVNNGPPHQQQHHQPEVRARVHVGGFTVNASSKNGVDTTKLANQAIDKAKSALIWWVMGGLITMLVVGGTIWYIKHSVKKALSEPSKSAVAAAAWDGKSPLSCSGSDEVTVKGVTAKLTAPAITASGSCKLTLVDVNLTAPTGIEANGNAVVTVQGGSITATNFAVKALGGAKVHLDKTEVTGKTQKLGAAEISGP